MEIVQDVLEGLNHKCKTIHYELIFSENTTIVNSFNIFCQFRAQQCEILKVFHTKNAWYKKCTLNVISGVFESKMKNFVEKLFRGLARIHSFKSYLYIQVGSDSIDNRNNHRNSFVWYLDTRHRSLTLGNLKRKLFWTSFAEFQK